MTTPAQTKRAQENEAYLQTPQVRAFLDAIASSEGADYGTVVYDKPGTQTITDFSKHPNIIRRRRINGKITPSSASGRYQFIKSTWNGVAKATGQADFSPRTQDINAVELLRQTGALNDLLAGDFDAAMSKAGTQWASVPKSSLGIAHNQNQRPDAFFRTAFNRSLRGAGVDPETARTLAVAPASPATRQASATALRQAPAAPTAPAPGNVGNLGEYLDSLIRPRLDAEALAARIESTLPPPTDVPQESTLAAKLGQLQPMPALPPGIQTYDDPLSELAPDNMLALQADQAREDALAAVFGGQPSLLTNLPASIDTAIQRLLREDTDGAA